PALAGRDCERRGHATRPGIGLRRRRPWPLLSGARRARRAAPRRARPSERPSGGGTSTRSRFDGAVERRGFVAEAVSLISLISLISLVVRSCPSLGLPRADRFGRAW